MGSTERLHIRWNDFESNIKCGLSELRQEKELFDVTLACGSKQIKAHKVILSACSPFFRSIIKSVPHEHPLLYLRGVQFHHLESLLAFIYNGEVNVTQEELDSFLAVAEELKIKGLAHNEAFISSLSVPESHPPPNKRPRNEDQGISPEPSITGLCISAYSLKTHSSLVISKETSPNPSKFPPQKEQDIPIGEDDDEIEDVTIVKEEDKYVFESNNDEVGLDNQSQELENELHDVKYIEDHIDFESESEELCCDTLRDSENTSHPDLNKVSALKNKVFISHPNQGIYNQSSLYDFNNTFEGNTPKRNLLPCAVSICYSPHVNSGEGYSYHRFPKAKDIRVKWITACHRQDPFNPETARVCSRHFEKDCFQRNLKAELMSNYGRTSSSKVRKTLRSNAVPTLYLVPESSIRAAEIEESNVERTKRLSSRNTKQIVNEVLTTPKQAV